MMPSRVNRGFTLIEVIMTIIILGILAGVLAPLIVSAINAYRDSAARNELTARGRLAIERLARELRRAVPNSTRVVSSGGNPGLEFVTSKGGGRYIDKSDNFDNTLYPIRFRANASLSSIDLLGTAYTDWSATDFIVIANYSPINLEGGDTSAPLINAPVDMDRDLDGTNEVQNIAFTPSEKFTFSSPTNQYQIADFTHEVGQNGTSIYWLRNAGIPVTYNGVGNWGLGDPILVSADSLTVSFSLDVSLIRIDMALIEDGETVNLSQEVQLRNSP